MTSRILYIERKDGGLRGPGRIGRVELSKTGKTLRYRGRSLRSLNGRGYKANYVDVETGQHYWVSGPRHDGMDSLYPAVVEVDRDVRKEYWTTIRGLPESAHLSSFRSPGKHTRRRPDPELCVRGSSRAAGSRRGV